MVIPVFQDIHYKNCLHTGKYVKFLYADSLIISLFYSTLFSDSYHIDLFQLKMHYHIYKHGESKGNDPTVNKAYWLDISSEHHRIYLQRL